MSHSIEICIIISFIQASSSILDASGLRSVLVTRSYGINDSVAVYGVKRCTFLLRIVLFAFTRMSITSFSLIDTAFTSETKGYFSGYRLIIEEKYYYLSIKTFYFSFVFIF